MTCELLLQRHRRKSFLHRIVTGDEKWIRYDNPKRKKNGADQANSIFAHPLYLEGSAECIMTNPIKPSLTTIDAFEPSIEVKTIRLRERIQQSDFSA